MPAASLALVDSAGGPLIATQTAVRVGGVPLVRVGDPVTPHGDGAHGGASMAAGSAIARVAGVPIVRAGDPATCGHLASGSSHVEVSA